jgi:hypothetical protein
MPRVAYSKMRDGIMYSKTCDAWRLRSRKERRTAAVTTGPLGWMRKERMDKRN